MGLCLLSAPRADPTGWIPSTRHQRSCPRASHPCMHFCHPCMHFCAQLFNLHRTQLLNSLAALVAPPTSCIHLIPLHVPCLYLTLAASRQLTLISPVSKFLPRVLLVNASIHDVCLPNHHPPLHSFFPACVQISVLSRTYEQQLSTAAQQP